jgi:hypothetical protein
MVRVVLGHCCDPLFDSREIRAECKEKDVQSSSVYIRKAMIDSKELYIGITQELNVVGR